MWLAAVAAAAWASFVCPPAHAASVSLTVQLTGDPVGMVFSLGGAITCPGTCTASVPAGLEVVLVAATTAPGADPVVWGGACPGTVGPAPYECHLTPTADAVVLAHFRQGTATVDVIEAGSGYGTVTSAPAGLTCPSVCAAQLPALHHATLTATAAPGSRFAGWGGGPCTGDDPSCTFNVHGETVTATFELLNPMPLTVAVGGPGSGAVTSSPAGMACAAGTCTAAFAAGQTVVLTAAPAAGSVFAGWGGACAGSASTCPVALNAPASVSAAFDRSSAGAAPAASPSALAAATPSQADTTAPTVVFDTPAADGARYRLGEEVVLHFRCADEASGLALCQATTPDGALLDTDATGDHRVSVTARDAAGNTTTATRIYRVLPPVTLRSAASGGWRLVASVRATDGARGLTASLGGTTLTLGQTGQPTAVRITLTSFDRAGVPSAFTTRPLRLLPGDTATLTPSRLRDLEHAVVRFAVRRGSRRLAPVALHGQTPQARPVGLRVATRRHAGAAAYVLLVQPMDVPAGARVYLVWELSSARTVLARHVLRRRAEQLRAGAYPWTPAGPGANAATLTGRVVVYTAAPTPSTTSTQRSGAAG